MPAVRLLSRPSNSAFPAADRFIFGGTDVRAPCFSFSQEAVFGTLGVVHLLRILVESQGEIDASSVTLQLAPVFQIAAESPDGYSDARKPSYLANVGSLV